MTPDRQHLPPKRKSHRAKKRAHPPTLTEFIQEAERLHDRALTMLRQDGHHSPIIVAWTRDGGREVIGLNLREGFPLTMGQVLAGLVRRRRIVAFIAINEAWMTRGIAASLDIMPSQHPDREQVLCVAAVHPEGKRMWCIPFAHEGGRLVLGTPLYSTGLSLGGTIPNALNSEEEER